MPRFRVLGPLEVEQEGAPVEIVGQRQRAVLTILLLEPNRLVPFDRIVDRLWGERPPRTATTSVHNAISQLRRALGAQVVETRAPGYLVHVAPSDLDLAEFERLLAAAREADAGERRRLLGEAIALWRGPALVDVQDATFAQGEIRRLEELRLTAIEDRLDLRLKDGEHTEVAGELEGLLAEHPHRERLVALLMLARYRSGRQADALEAYHRARRALDAIGLEPTRDLQDLHGAILRQERTLEPSGTTAARSDHTADVMRALLAGRLTPVLGPGATLDGMAPPDAELAARLSELFEYPDGALDSLPRVAQYVSLSEGVGPLYDELHALLDRDYEPGPVHRYLASLAPLLRARDLPQLLLVTTSYDDTLERAHAEAGEAIDLVSYVAHGRDRGRFRHTAPDGSTRIVDEPNLDTRLGDGTRPVVLKIHGCVDRQPSREWESFVVSEDDYIDYLAGVEPASALPVQLAARLRRSHYLFLGYDVLDWNLRVFLRRMWSDERVAYRSWAVQDEPAPLTRGFWRQRSVDILDVPLAEYVETLRLHSEDISEASV
jgi:DNA-binding SARP family transcriptional activator